MSGDYTRSSFKPPKNYSGVKKQQGRVALDADWNEDVEIQDRRRRAETVDLGGRCWVGGDTPDAFLITSLSTGELAIAAGRMYVDGLLAENHGAPPYDDFDGTLAEAGSEEPVQFGDQPHRIDAELVPASGRTDLLYLDVWHREVTALQDGEIRETALGGPDTATRVQTVWQVRALAGVDTQQCEDPIELYDETTRPSGGRLTTSTVAPAASEDPCIVSPAGGYRGIENRLYRVEIHERGELNTARFKWSKNNASVLARVERITAEGPNFRLALSTLGRDEVLRFDVGALVEVLDDKRELEGIAGEMARVVDIDEANRELLVTPASAAPWTSPAVGFEPARPEMNTRIIRWDHTSADSDLLLALEPGPTNLEDGVRVTFSGTDFKVGDYWHFAARTTDGSVEALTEAPPRGIHHHYCRLALVRWDGAGAPATVIEDCRNQWPPAVQVGAGQGCCTFVVEPGQSIQYAINHLDTIDGGCVCLRAGEHTIEDTITISGRSNVVLQGESSGAVIRGETLPLLSADETHNLRVRGITFETTATYGIGDMGEVLAPPSYSEIDYNYLSDPVSTLISISNSSSVELSDLVLREDFRSFSGVLINRTHDIQIQGNLFEGLFSGIEIVSGERGNIVNNLIRCTRERQGFVGVYCQDPWALQILHNQVDYCYSAIELLGERLIYASLISGNFIISAFPESHYGIAIVGDSDCTIDQNTISSNAIFSPQFAIYCENAVNTTVEDNYISSFGEAGIFMSDGSKNTLVRNHLELGDVCGIMATGETGLRVYENTIEEILNGGLIATGLREAVTLSRNRFLGCGTTGDEDIQLAPSIYIQPDRDGGNPPHVIVEGCYVLNTGTTSGLMSTDEPYSNRPAVGVWIEGAASCRIQGNELLTDNRARYDLWPSVVQDDRALWVSAAPTASGTGTAMILDNRITGIGNDHLVELEYYRPQSQEPGLSAFRKVTFSNNVCDHIEANESLGAGERSMPSTIGGISFPGNTMATVRFSVNLSSEDRDRLSPRLIVMGNTVSTKLSESLMRTPVPEAFAFYFGGLDQVVLMGNVIEGNISNLRSSIPLQPNDVNAIFT